MELNKIQKLVYEEYIKNGYLEMFTVCGPNEYTKLQRLVDIAELGLIGTEESEAIEDVRKLGYPMLLDKLGIELSDIIIRALNIVSRKGIDIEPVLLAKHMKNMSRGERHGKKI